MDNIALELLSAKAAATLYQLWGITNPKTVSSIVAKFLASKKQVQLDLERYLQQRLVVNIPESWTCALESHSVFYSFCYGLFRIVPATILTLGYPVAVIVSDQQKSCESDYYAKLNKLYSQNNKQEIDFKLLSHKDQNLLFKIKSLILKGYKIVVFIDGNKGVEQSIKNMFVTPFKETTLLFHQGFGLLNYLCKTNTLHGLSISTEGDKVRCTHWSDSVDTSISKDLYMSQVMSNVIKNLDSFIQLENVHQWEVLNSMYTWPRIQNEAENHEDPITKDFYTSFRIRNNEYYILHHRTFTAYATDQETYRKFRISK